MDRFTKDNWLVVGLLLAMVLAASLGLYLPQNRKLNNLKAEIMSHRVSLASEAQKAAVVPAIIRQIEEMKGRYKDFDRRLPEQKDLGDFLREISGNLSKDKSLTSESCVPGSPNREELFHTLPIRMKLGGSYLSLAGFFKRLDGMQRLTRVKELKIDAKNDESLEIELEINIYFTES